MKKKTKLMTIAAAVLGILLLAVVVILKLNTEGVTQIADTLTFIKDSELKFDVEDLFDGKEEALKEIVFETDGVDTSIPGEYEMAASYKKDTYTIKVVVVDVAEIEFTNRVLFTNDVTKMDLTSLIEDKESLDGVTLEITAYVKDGNLKVLADDDIKALEANIPTPGKQDELKALEGEGTPEAEGIYKAVVKITEEGKTEHFEEIRVIYDTTGATIVDVADKVITVSKDALDKAPEVKSGDYKAIDNVDGRVESETEVKLVDKEKHIYHVLVSCTDRAGNRAEATFKITLDVVKETVTDKNVENNGASKNENSNNGSSINNGGLQSSESEVIDSDYKNLNRDQQEIVNAGYYNVVSGDGGFYVLVKGIEEKEKGYTLIDKKLESLGLEAIGGWGQCYSSENNWYVLGVDANQIREKSLGSEDEDYWRE